MKREGVTRRPLPALAIMVLSALAIAGLVAVRVQSMYATKAGEQEVEAAVREMVDAYVANDYDRYFSVMANEVTIWSGGGWDPERMPKERYYDLWSANVERGFGISTGSIEDLRIQMSPENDVGVATFIMPVTTRVPPGDGNSPRDVTYKVTHVWFKRGSRWELAHYYWSVVYLEPAGAAPVAR